MVRARDISGDLPAGWQLLADELARRLEALLPGFEVLAVRQRYGRLEIVLHPDADPRAVALVREAEAASIKVCQCCGEPGGLCVTQNGRGYFLAALCPDHQVTSLEPFADLYEQVEQELEPGQQLILSDPRFRRRCVAG